MRRRVIFGNKILPYFLVAPQLAITIIFFFWPAAQAIYYSVLLQDPFGLHTEFVWLENFRTILTDPLYLGSVQVTVVFSGAVAALSMGTALLLAVMADRRIRGTHVYRTLLMWPYAVAPAVAASLWLFIFHPDIGFLGRWLNDVGLAWDYKLNGTQALLLVILASAWKEVSYNFLFFLAGLQAIPKSVVEAASMDAGPARCFLDIIFPLLSPTSFFLLVVNVVYVFFDTFGVIHALTGGGPAKATETLIYKVYTDGVMNLDLGGSSAQSVILMLLVIGSPPSSSASSSGRCTTDGHTEADGRLAPPFCPDPRGGDLRLSDLLRPHRLDPRCCHHRHRPHAPPARISRAGELLARLGKRHGVPRFGEPGPHALAQQPGHGAGHRCGEDRHLHHLRLCNCLLSLPNADVLLLDDLHHAHAAGGGAHHPHLQGGD
jgi:sn-glycerol 3-phosphate transport system permease protein